MRAFKKGGPKIFIPRYELVRSTDAQGTESPGKGEALAKFCRANFGDNGRANRELVLAPRSQNDRRY